jgi:DNA-binding CsgD family transcriptional regulator
MSQIEGRLKDIDAADRATPENHAHAGPDFPILPELRSHGAAIRNSIARSMLEDLPDGILFVERTGQIFYLNGTAAQILAEDDGLRLRDGALAAVRVTVQRKLLRSLAAAMPHAHGRTTPVDSALMVARFSRRPPYAVVIVPLTPTISPTPVQPLALVTIADLTRRNHGLDGRLSELFGLTKAEARVAVAIADGDLPIEIAAAAGLRITTVRSQLQAVLRKTGAKRQADLVRIIHRIPTIGRT